MPRICGKGYFKLFFLKKKQNRAFNIADQIMKETYFG